MSFGADKLISLALDHGVGSTSKTRRQANGQRPDDFEKTLHTMRQAMELAMADRFLSTTLTPNQGKDEEPMAGGVSLNQIGLNMLSTLAKLNAPAAVAPAQPTGLSAPQAPREATHAPVAAADLGTSARDSASRQDPPLTHRVRGMLSKQFESGADGSAAVGYDRVGGTSYGTYQLSSRQGTLERFLDFVDDLAPRLAQKLRQAGPADTGSRTGLMPEIWKGLAKEQPELLSSLETAFIRESHYLPAVQSILQSTGLDLKELPGALREVVFSTSVQHGPKGATSLFTKALESLTGDTGTMNALGLDDAVVGQLIDKMYDLRSRQFGSSTEQVQAAVANRLRSEKSMALALLGGTPFSELA